MKQTRQLLPPSSVPRTARTYRWRMTADSKTLYQHAGGDDGEGGTADMIFWHGDRMEVRCPRGGDQWTPARKLNPPMPLTAIPMVIPAAVIVCTEGLAFRVVTQTTDCVSLMPALLPSSPSLN
ncbi:hypothetical protein H101_08018 [Trichophyton interdigitale H6]|nr:hypothetical protein H101_08018 [Trichophyton interdigitale H6]